MFGYYLPLAELLCLFFFFQAEDGIRDVAVTGVQTCALPISFKTGGTGLDSHVDMSVNGNGSNTNLWTVDGVNNMDVGSNATLLVFPSIDSIREFRVERNSFSAEYGQAQGAVINLITKSGGNQFHGAGFEFLRRDGLNANDPFLKASGDRKSTRLNSS